MTDDDAKRRYGRLLKLSQDRGEAVRQYPQILKLEAELKRCHDTMRELQRLVAPAIDPEETHIQFESIGSVALRRYEALRAVIQRWGAL